jgi:hypothetical protein
LSHVNKKCYNYYTYFYYAKLWVSIGICDNIGVTVRSFIWGRNFCHLDNWKNLTKPKFHGVLGIHTATQISLFLKNTFGLIKSQSGWGVLMFLKFNL